MASLAFDSPYRRVTVDEFLDMDFRGARAELENGIISMMAGGSEEHSRIAANILNFLGPDFAARTGDDTVRLPDVSVHCGRPSAPENRAKKLLSDPVVVVEVLSPSTAKHDQRTKMEEYRSLPGTRDILMVDPSTFRIRHARRNPDGDWVDGWLAEGIDVTLASIGQTVPYAEIFADD